MRILVLGHTQELIVFADLMQKAGAEVETIAAPRLGHVDQITTDVDVVAFSGETMTDSHVAQLRQACGHTRTLMCDITDGADPLSTYDAPLPEHMLQAATGLAQITGQPDAPPTISDVPFIAVSSALYAASFVLAVSRSGGARSVTVSRKLAALNALTTFLPAALQGKAPAPIGNAHPSSSPWNTYKTRDGSVLICTSKDTQWAKLRDLIGDDAVRAARYDVHSARIADRDALDAIITAWTSQYKTGACVASLLDAGIPAGPILPIGQVLDDPNMKLRQRQVASSGGPDALSLFQARPLGAARRARRSAPKALATPDRPLAGLRVIEMGQFTTAPLVCRHLAGLGAHVLKVENPGGEASRQWKPIIDGVGHFFTITNTGKHFVELNLRDPEQMAVLKQEIVQADLIVENMRPDVMGKLGLGHAELSALNPDVTLCSISGFGAFGAYPGRAAYDTIIQGMSGIMDLTRSQGLPTKLGISAADILGAQVALFAILLHLDEAGLFIDVSMQDVAAYAALLARSGAAGQDNGTALSYAHSVQDLAQSHVVHRDLLTEIPDPNGVMRLAPKLPYRLD